MSTITPESIIEIVEDAGIYWVGTVQQFATSNEITVEDVARMLAAGPVAFGGGAAPLLHLRIASVAWIGVDKSPACPRLKDGMPHQPIIRPCGHAVRPSVTCTVCHQTLTRAAAPVTPALSA